MNNPAFDRSKAEKYSPQGGSVPNGGSVGAGNGKPAGKDDDTGVVVPLPDMSILKLNRRTPPSCPVKLAGSFWRDWIEAAAEGSGSPVDYVFAAVLTAGGALIGNARWVQAWPGFKQPPTVWFGIVGDPSVGKTPAIRPTIELCKSLEVEMAADFDVVRRKWEAEKVAASTRREAWELKVETAVKNALKAETTENEPPPEMPQDAEVRDKPRRPRLQISDASIEALGLLLGSNPKGLYFWRDELAGLIGNFDRYGGSGGDRAFWLEAYDGGSYTIDKSSLRISRSLFLTCLFP